MNDVNMMYINSQKIVYSELILRQKGEIDHLSVSILRRDESQCFLGLLLHQGRPNVGL